MAIRCPQCGADYDVTLFTFGRGFRCDCGAWVDMVAGHRESAARGRQARGSTQTLSNDDEALLAICRTTYARIMASLPGNISTAQLAIADEVWLADFEMGEHNEEMIAVTSTIFAVLADGRSLQRRPTGDWLILRDYG